MIRNLMVDSTPHSKQNLVFQNIRCAYASKHYVIVLPSPTFNSSNISGLALMKDMAMKNTVIGIGRLS